VAEPGNRPTDANGRVNAQIVIKISVSFLFGIVAFFATQILSSQMTGSTATGIAVALFIGGIAFITQFLIDLATRIESGAQAMRKLEASFSEHTETTHQMITDKFAKINDATELFGLVEASALKTDAMTQLVKHSTTVAKGAPSLIFDFTQAEIVRLSGYLKELGQGGDVTYEGEDRDWLIGLTKVASNSIDATSLTTVDAGGRSYIDGGLWTSELGQRYLDAQREALHHGVKIRRLFIMDRPDMQPDQELLGIMNQQTAMGIEVRLLRPDRIGPLFDFIVMDGVLSYQSTVASRTMPESRPIIVTTTLVTNPDRVQKRIDRFQLLWSAGTNHDVPGSNSDSLGA